MYSGARRREPDEGLITFFWYAGVNRLRTPVLLFDAAGLSFFAVAGTQKTVEFGLSPVASALLGMSTGIGGGVMRDVLLSEIPQVAENQHSCHQGPILSAEAAGRNTARNAD